MRAKLRKFLCTGLTAVLLSASLQGRAINQFDYVLDTDGTTRIPIPLSYTLDTVITLHGEGVTPLKNPADLVVADDGSLFVADAGNNRVVHLDREGNILHEYTQADGTNFKFPSSVCLDKDGDVYISDTGNARIVHMTVQGDYVETFVKPDSELVDEGTTFDIYSLYVTDIGTIYAMKGENFMMIDADNRFIGYVGANKVSFSLTYWFVRTFGSEEQKQYIPKPKQAVYNSFTIADNGLVLATVAQNYDQIQIINAVGKNIFPAGMYGEAEMDAEGQITYPSFVDIAVNNSIITALDQASCKLYQYDMQGNLLTVFGGKGTSKGLFQVPAKCEMDDENRVYVLDSAQSSITIYTPTSFMDNIIAASAAYQEGDYTTSFTHWQEVYRADASYPLANTGLALNMQKRGELVDAMAYYKVGDDKTGYSSAFDEYRHLLFRANFFWVVLVLAVLLALFIAAFLWSKKASVRYIDEFYHGPSEGTKGKGGTGHDRI